MRAVLSFSDAILVFVGGALGSALRYFTLRVATRFGVRASVALMALNLLGCLIAGLVVGAIPDGGRGRLFLIGGVLGGYTTFSAVSLECAVADRSARRRVFIETALSIVFAAPAALIGIALGRAMAGGWHA